jgi:fructoselysine-6-P-deglycase FrlB-like protein
MQAQAELRNLPQALTEMFTRGRSGYERAVRGIRWGDGPIYVLADARSLSAGLVALYAIEELLHRPVILREASSFLAYSLGTVRTGAPVVAVSGEGEGAELLAAVRAVRENGAQVLAVAPAASALNEAAHQVFPLPDVAGAPASGVVRACLEHAALGYLALIAARQLARPAPSLDRLEKDWAELPASLDRIVNQFGNAVHSLAGELAALGRILFAGSGLYYAAAMRAVDAREHEGRIPAQALDLAGLRSGWVSAFRSGTGALLLTGSRSQSREDASAVGAELKGGGAALFAVTDANDHELGRQARLTLLLPDLAELPASILALALAGWTAREMVQTASAAYAGRDSRQA